jgi:hypothetical protein
VILLPALADVVQQARDIENLAVHPVLQDARGDRQFLDQFLALDLREGGDHLDRVLVHRVAVVHVELHHRDDGGEFGDEGRQHAQLVHPPQRPFGVAVLEQQVEEDAAGLGVPTHRVVDHVEPRLHLAHGVGVDQVAGPQRFLEEPQDIQLVGEERLCLRDGDAVLLDRVAVLHLLAPCPAAQEAEDRGRLLDMAGLELGQEDAGQFAHAGGVAEIVLHEMLDRAAAGMVLVSQPFGDLHLDVECHLVLSAIGDQVQVAAHRPEKPLGRVEGGEFLGAEHAEIDQVPRAGHAMFVFRDPVERLQVPQPALALLDVGFQHVALTALLAVARAAFFQLGLDELPHCSVEQLLAQGCLKLRPDGFGPAEKPHLQQAGADRDVLPPQPQAFLHRARRMPDLHVKVPQHVERGFDHVLDGGGHFPRRDEQQVDVGERRHLAAAITADRHHRHALGLGGERVRVQVGLGNADDLAHEAIGQVTIGPCGPSRRKRHGGESLRDLGAAPRVSLLQHGDGGAPHGSRAGGLRAGRIDPGADGVGVEYLRLRDDERPGFRRDRESWVPVRDRDRQGVLGRGQ